MMKTTNSLSILNDLSAGGPADDVKKFIAFAAIVVAIIVLITILVVSNSYTKISAPAQAQDRMPIYFTRIDDPSVSRQFMLKAGQDFLVGRSVKANWRVADDMNVSNNHCKLSMESGKPMIWDLNSLNGTLVNGEYISESQYIFDNDIVSIGQHEWRVNY